MAARYDTDAGQTVSNGDIINFDSATFGYDSHSSVTTGASWKFTASVSGIYSVDPCITFNDVAVLVGQRLQLELFKNGTLIATLDEHEVSVSGNFVISLHGSTEIALDKGDYIDIRVGENVASALSLVSAEEDNYISIHRIGF